jgi:hypothetical protein
LKIQENIAKGSENFGKIVHTPTKEFPSNHHEENSVTFLKQIQLVFFLILNENSIRTFPNGK